MSDSEYKYPIVMRDLLGSADNDADKEALEILALRLYADQDDQAISRMAEDVYEDDFSDDCDDPDGYGCDEDDRIAHVNEITELLHEIDSRIVSVFICHHRDGACAPPSVACEDPYDSPIYVVGDSRVADEEWTGWAAYPDGPLTREQVMRMIGAYMERHYWNTYIGYPS